MVRVTVARLGIHEGRLPTFAQPEAILRDRHLRWFERDRCRGLSRLQCGDLRLGQLAGLVPLRLSRAKKRGRESRMRSRQMYWAKANLAKVR